MHQKSKLAVS